MGKHNKLENIHNQPRKKPSDSQTPYAERFGSKHLSAERSKIMNLSARRFEIKN